MRGFQKGHIGYNKGKILVEYNCQDCGKRVQKRTKRCRKCYAKTQIGKVSYVCTEEIRKKLSTSHIGNPVGILVKNFRNIQEKMLLLGKVE
jgi:predicted ATP-dependent serine protease